MHKGPLLPEGLPGRCVPLHQPTAATPKSRSHIIEALHKRLRAQRKMFAPGCSTVWQPLTLAHQKRCTMVTEIAVSFAGRIGQ